ncbi:AraC family transcriptional regulator [Oscillospiraceae bacterium PP1C4]
MASGIFKHSYKTKTRESLPIAIYNSGVQQCGPLHSWGPGLRDHFLVHHVISGCGSYTADGITNAVTAGDTFIVYPSAIVTYCADESDPWEYCWVGFNGAEANVMIAQTSFSQECPVVRFSEPEMIKNAVMDIYGASGTSPASELRAIGLLYLFLALLIDQAGAKNTSSDLSLEYVESAVRFIAHNYSSAIDINDIAASVGISRSHLYRVFMRHIATPPNEYLTRFRISQACELLERSSLSISAVAASVGYDDQLYFSRVFKKITSKSPSAYYNESLAKNEHTLAPSFVQK